MAHHVVGMGLQLDEMILEVLFTLNVSYESMNLISTKEQDLLEISAGVNRPQQTSVHSLSNQRNNCMQYS